MDKVKIKRVKRNKKTATAKEKLLAGLGVGGTLMGGIAGGATSNNSQKPIVRTQNREESAKTASLKDKLSRIFKKGLENTVGAKTAQAYGDYFSAGWQDMGSGQWYNAITGEWYDAYYDEYYTLGGGSGGGGGFGGGGSTAYIKGQSYIWTDGKWYIYLGDNPNDWDNWELDTSQGATAITFVAPLPTNLNYDLYAIQNANNKDSVLNAAAMASLEVDRWQSYSMADLNGWRQSSEASYPNESKAIGDEYNLAKDKIDKIAKDAKDQITIEAVRRIAQLDGLKTAPTITLKGPATVELVVGGEGYNEEGWEEVGPEIQVEITGGPVYNNQPWTYTLTYTATDSETKLSTKAERTVIVKAKGIPTISLEKASGSLSVGQKFENPTILETVDGQPTDPLDDEFELKVGGDTVPIDEEGNVTTPGKYNITFQEVNKQTGEGSNVVTYALEVKVVGVFTAAPDIGQPEYDLESYKQATTKEDVQIVTSNNLVSINNWRQDALLELANWANQQKKDYPDDKAVITQIVKDVDKTVGEIYSRAEKAITAAADARIQELATTSSYTLPNDPGQPEYDLESYQRAVTKEAVQSITNNNLVSINNWRQDALLELAKWRNEQIKNYQGNEAVIKQIFSDISETIAQNYSTAERAITAAQDARLRELANTPNPQAGTVTPNLNGGFETHLQGGNSSLIKVPDGTGQGGGNYISTPGGTLFIQDASGNVFTLNVSTGVVTDSKGMTLPADLTRELLIALSNYQDSQSAAAPPVSGITNGQGGNLGSSGGMASAVRNPIWTTTPAPAGVGAPGGASQTVFGQGAYTPTPPLAANLTMPGLAMASPPAGNQNLAGRPATVANPLQPRGPEGPGAPQTNLSAGNPAQQVFTPPNFLSSSLTIDMIQNLSSGIAPAVLNKGLNHLAQMGYTPAAGMPPNVLVSPGGHTVVLGFDSSGAAFTIPL